MVQVVERVLLKIRQKEPDGVLRLNTFINNGIKKDINDVCVCVCSKKEKKKNFFFFQVLLT